MKTRLLGCMCAFQGASIQQACGLMAQDFQRGGATADAGEAAEAPERAEAVRKPKDKTQAKKAKLEDLEEIHVPLEVQRLELRPHLGP